mgnify:CR=1 FL=1
MILELKENTPHGTKEYPYDQYFIHNMKQTFQFPVHWHDELEIIYIKQGTLQISIAGLDYTGNAGSVFLVNPRELHLMGSSDLSIAYYTLLFPLEFISFQSMDDLETTLLQPLRSGQLIFKHHITDVCPSGKLCPILDQIIAVNQDSSSMKQIETRILLLQFFLQIVENPSLIISASGNRTNTQKELLIYIQHHYMERITLHDLAEHFHLSEKYISRYFKEHFYLTFTDYVNHLRLTHAKKLLETTDLSVTEIALRCGFPNVSYFIRTFKTCYGNPPLKYRKSTPLGESRI